MGDERTQLVGWLDTQRAIIHYKCEGLSDEDARRAVLPSSPLMTVAGVVSHLRWTEHNWFEVIFLGGSRAGNPYYLAEPANADMRVDPGVSLAELLERYDRQCRRSDEIVAAHALEETGRHPRIRSAAATLRWMLIHMVEETARHAGHLDAMRELIDGRTGYY